MSPVPMPVRRMAILVLFVLGTPPACTAVPAPGEGPVGNTAASDEEGLVPPGYGTLLQDDITLTLFAGDVRVKVTPLDESVIRLAAPDTYRRLHDLAESTRPRVESRAGVDDVQLFLVSFFTRSPNVDFEPNDLQLLNRGIRFRRMAWQPISSDFGSQRLQQEVPQTAVYGFAPEIDLEIELAVDYGGVVNAGWTAILTRIRQERGRVRARAGGG